MSRIEIQYKNVNDLIPYINNPRINDDAVDMVASSIKNFGFKVPIVLDSKNEIVTGHTRLKAAKKLGLEEVPCIIADDLTQSQIKAFRVADNKVAEFSEWDFDLLSIELEDIEDIDMELFGFDDLEIDVIDEPVEDDFEPEILEQPKSKHGDIYKLGNHRLMCGDSTNITDVEKLMNGKKAEMIFTDPPYLMGFTGNVHGDGSKSFNAKFGEIKNDKMSKEEGDIFISNIFNVIKNFVLGAYYVCFYRLGVDYIFRALDVNELDYRAVIIWDKGNHTLSNSDYMSKYEPIIYGWIDEHNFYGDRSNFDIWNISRTKKNELHPTMKPIELCSKAINNSSKKNDIVLDLFGGSGSTLITCEQLKRNCYMMELDPRYVDVIINRWEEFTGEKAELINE